MINLRIILEEVLAGMHAAIPGRKLAMATCCTNCSDGLA